MPSLVGKCFHNSFAFIFNLNNFGTNIIIPIVLPFNIVMEQIFVLLNDHFRKPKDKSNIKDLNSFIIQNLGNTKSITGVRENKIKLRSI